MATHFAAALCCSDQSDELLFVFIRSKSFSSTLCLVTQSWVLHFLSLYKQRSSFNLARPNCTNTSWNHAWRIMLCCAVPKIPLQQHLPGRKLCEAAFLIPAELWYSCHILVEAFFIFSGKANKPGSNRRGGIACLCCRICPGVAAVREEWCEVVGECCE